MADQTEIDLFDKAQDLYGRYFCRKCLAQDKIEPASERFSMGYYAAMQCDLHWSENSLNNDNVFDPDYAGESLEGEPDNDW